MTVHSRLPVNGHPIRVLVVDDSVVVRRVLTRAFEQHGDFDVVGSAANGRLALEKIEYRRPDIVVLELEMPEMDGLEVLAELRRQHSDVPVVVFSRLDGSGGTVHEALALGAADVVVKPRVSATGFGEEYVHTRLVPLLRALARPASALPRPGRSPVVRAASAPKVRSARGRRRPDDATPISAVVIGVSTGGPDALAMVVGALPAAFSVPVLVVQHMPPIFTKALAERLDRIALVDVFEARHGQKVTPGQVYVAPGGHHMGVQRTPTGVVIHLNDGPKENSCRPSADVLFRSAAEVYGAGVLGVVLTGMGQDGLRGSEEILEAGGRLIAQSAGSSVVASMPAAVAELADAVVPLEQVADELTSLVGRWGP